MAGIITTDEDKIRDVEDKVSRLLEREKFKVKLFDNDTGTLLLNLKGVIKWQESKVS